MIGSRANAMISVVGTLRHFPRQAECITKVVKADLKKDDRFFNLWTVANHSLPLTAR
jgi:hypothetical protein